jgi:glycosyltransferase involved in cell wall biosynthesis
VKILTITNLYPPYYIGGYELACKDVMVELRKRGHDVRILTSDYECGKTGADADPMRLLNMHPINRPDLHPEIERYPDTDYIEDEENYRLTLETIRREKPDLVYAWNLWGLSIKSMVRALDDAGYPAVLHIGDYHLIQEHYHDLVSLRDRPLIVVSESVKFHFVHIGFYPEKIKVIYRALSGRYLSRKKREKSPGGRFAMLSVSQVIPIKGIHLVLEAMHLLKEQGQLGGVSFDIYGDVSSSYEKELKGLMGMYGLEKNIRFRGWLPREKVRQRFVRYDACLHPSLREEPFGIAILEAMAKGTPVIATSSGGPAEVITHEVTGMLFPMGDAAKMADMILRLKSDGRLWKRISRKSRDMVKHDFSMRNIMDAIEAHLKACVRSA